MDSKKVTLVLLVAVVFVATIAQSTLATRQFPPLLTSNILLQDESNLGCLPSGGFCMFQPMNCCGYCGCLYPLGICYGSRLRWWPGKKQEDHPGAGGCRGFCCNHCSLHPCHAPISTTAHFKHTAARWKQRPWLSPQWRLLHVPTNELLRGLWMPISSRGLLWIKLLKVVSTLSFRIILKGCDGGRRRRAMKVGKKLEE
ncbi:hypothetical protein SADUNF_Sadunf17G0011700 [Salix dunnii]|uniref:DUF5637 domain-containing protein n=1 Tax=Salix dunnii TaxID=1413687 RepID=A0A835J253_9ROSI|nr:hypothetical protein SADUNF_Sadunf17G0011700 [Salix dunnii]